MSAILRNSWWRTCGPSRARRLGTEVVAAQAAWRVALLLPLMVAACGGETPILPLRTEASDARNIPSRPRTDSAPAPPKAVSIAAVPATTPAPRPAAPTPDWQLLLEDGIESYENGAYGNAIRKLEEAADDPRADNASRVRGLKYLAFSYCVSPDPGQNRKPSNNLTLCRQAFERALAIDPAFELAQAERGHPVWGKQFQAARLAQSKKTQSQTSVTSSKPPSVADKKGVPTSASGTSADPGKP